MVTPDHKRAAVQHLQSAVLVGQSPPLSQRRAVAVMGVSRRSVRRVAGARGQRPAPARADTGFGFYTRTEARCLIENYRVHFNSQTPFGSGLPNPR